MSDNTRRMLVALGENPNLVDEFQKDAIGVMNRYDVPADHQKMILQGDKASLKKAADLDDETLQFIIF